MSEIPENVIVGQAHNSKSLLTKEQIETLMQERGISPKTRRYIVIALVVIAIACIGTEAFLAFLGQDSGGALITVAASCAGGIAGMAVPQPS